MPSISDLLSDARRDLGAAQPDRAAAALQQVLRQVPTHYEALCLLGFVLKQRNDLDEAEHCYVRAVAIRPESAPAWFALGTILHALGRHADAADSFRRVLRLDPTHRDACVQLGNLLFAGDPEGGLALFRRAVDIDPAHAPSRACLASGYLAMGTLHSAREQWTDMFAAYRQAIEVDAAHAAAHFHLATELLRQGCFDEGWREYEWRWQRKKFDTPRGFSQPQWRGKALDGARILLHAEQGFGDTLQFARYAPLVAERGGTVLLEAPRDLVRLLASLPGVAEVVARGASLPAFEWQCPLMSLPLAFGTTLETIPANVPYLSARPVPLEPGSPAPDLPTLRIGLVWAGNPAHQHDARRSIALDLLAVLTHLEGTRWYSLQKGVAWRTPSPADLVDLAPRIRDFADTAAFVAGLDLVITVDTAVAHLAGAMGKPVWILVESSSDWRWMLARDDSPWYPSARLFRQAARGRWEPVVDSVHQALLELLRSQ